MRETLVPVAVDTLNFIVLRTVSFTESGDRDPFTSRGFKSRDLSASPPFDCLDFLLLLFFVAMMKDDDDEMIGASYADLANGLHFDGLVPIGVLTLLPPGLATRLWRFTPESHLKLR